MDCGKNSTICKSDSSKLKKNNAVMPITFPNVAYGNLKKNCGILFKNATVWTNEKDGILVESDVLVKWKK
jgi:hypothetical protein